MRSTATFSDWILIHRRSAIALFTLLGIDLLTAVAEPIKKEILEVLGKFDLATLWVGSHATLAAILLGMTLALKPKVQRVKHPESSKSVEGIHIYTAILFFTWALLYLGMVAQKSTNLKREEGMSVQASKLMKAAKSSEPAKKLIVEGFLVGNLPSKNQDDHVMAALKHAASLLEEESLSRFSEQIRNSIKNSEDSEKDFGELAKTYSEDLTKKIRADRIWSSILNALNNIQTLMFFLCFWALAFRHSATGRVGILLFGALVILLLAYIELSAERELALSPSLISGLLAGVGLALVVGRLDSTYLKVPLGAIILLYGYAILQPIWFQFRDDIIFFSFTGVAMVLKFFLYILISWLLVEGRMLYLFHELRILNGLTEVSSDDPLLEVVTVDARMATFLENLDEEMRE